MKQDWEHIIINTQEIERYLGYRKIQPDAAIRSLIQECVQELEGACTPRSVQASYPILWGESKMDPKASQTSASDKKKTSSPASEQIILSEPLQNLSGNSSLPSVDRGKPAAAASHLFAKSDRTIRIAGMEIHSRSLTRNLKGCTQAILFAATLGPGCDRLVRRAEITSMVKAAVLQSAGAAMIEAYADQVNREIIQKAGEKALYARPRFSPGYGDLPLALQKDFFRILDITRTIGVSLSDTLLMTPTKSITAIIGLSPKETSCILEGCEICNLHRTCPYARDAGDA